MKKKFKSFSRREKLKFVALIVLSLLSIGYGIYSCFNPILSTDNLLSIVIALLGVLCFQTVLENFFSLKDIEDAIYNIKATYGGNYVEITERQKFENINSIEDRFKDAEYIHMFSHSNHAIFQPDKISMVLDGIKGGTKFKFIGYNPDDKEKIKNLKKYKMVQQMEENPPLTSLKNYLKVKRENSFTDEQLQFNVCDIDFPFGMTIVKKRSGEVTVKVDLYTIKTRHMDRKCIFLSSQNSMQRDLIDFFINQWDEAWKESKKSSQETDSTAQTSTNQ